ncbi:hypothetical protein [Paracoccus albus]|uniref:hypothetical protein n=1 Tax=Paracoccus albus TaxID=3017784 RepID=UPI0022F0651E|nr:hypothetical protein [Paracoccus albus]WBU59938.1 hypothetical protein PAF20_14450 [Paracoccus albus]
MSVHRLGYLHHAGDLSLQGQNGDDGCAAVGVVIGSGSGVVLALIEWLVPGSFVASSGAAINWQQMVY